MVKPLNLTSHHMEILPPENLSIKRVKLKTRQLNANTSIRRSYIEHIVGQSREHIDLSEMKAIDSTESAPAVREVIMDTSIDRPFFRVRNHTKHHTINLTQKEETVSDLRDSQNKKQKGAAAVKGLPPNFNNTDHDLFDVVHKREADDDSENRTGSLDSYRSDDAASELDNYLDALTTMDSEIETDNEIKARPIPSFFSKEYNKMDSSVKEETAALDSEIESDNESKAKPTPNFFSKEANKMNSNVNEERATLNSEIETDHETRSKPTPTSFSKEYRMDSNANEERELLDEHLGLHMVRESSAQSSLSNERMSSPPNEHSSILADSTLFRGTQRAFSGVFTDPETSADEIHDTNFENKAYCEPLGKESSTNLVSEQMIPAPLSESRVASSSSCITDTTSQIYMGLHASPEGIQSGASNENASPVNTTGIEKSSMCFDGEHSPPVNSDVLVPVADTNVIFCCPDEEHGEVDKLMEDDFPNSSDGSKIPSVAENNKVNLGLISKDTEILSGALLQLGDADGPDLNLQMQDDLPLEKQMTLLCTEEPSTEGIVSMSSVSDSPQIIKAPNLEITSPICIDDSSPPLSMFNEEKLHGSLFQGCVDSGGSTLLGKSPPIPPLDGSSSISEPDDLSGPVNNSLLSDEKFECARTLTDPEDVADFAVNEVTSPEDADNFAENEVIASGIPSPGPSFDMKVPQESCTSDQAEFRREDELPNNLKVLPGVSGNNTRDSFLVNETKESPSATGEAPAESSSPYSMSEYTKVNEVSYGTMHKEDFSSNRIVVEEDHVSSDLVSEQQELDVTEASSPKNLIDLDVWQVPDGATSQGEHVVNAGPQDSAAAGYVLDSSSVPDCGELNHVHCVEQFELAQEDLSLTDGSRAAISFVEMGGEKLVSPEPKNKSASVDSVVEHYLGNIEASNSEDMTGADGQLTSKLASPGKEEAKAVNDLGDPNSAESIHDSCDNREMKLIISVPCQEDQKMVVSLRNSRTEERLLESSDASDIETVKHAEVTMHPFEVNEDDERPSENQISQPLASYEPCQGANGDVLLSNDVITEISSPVKEVFNSRSSDESSEISSLQYFGKLNLSDTQFEIEHSHGKDGKDTETWPLVPETARDSIEAVSSYESDIPSAHASSLNQQEAEAGSFFPSSYGIPASSSISSVSLASLQSFPGLNSFGTAVVQQESSELPPDKDPPLPPLPPLQWRMGKLRSSSIMSNGEMVGPQNGLNSLTGEIAGPRSGLNSLTTLPLYHLGGSVVMGGAEMQQANPFLQVEIHPSDHDQFGNQTLVKERRNSFQSSALVPAMEDKKCEEDMITLDVEMTNLPANSTVVSHVEEDQQKNESCQEALVGEVPQLLNPLTSLLELEDEKSQHFHAVHEGESVEPPKSSASQPTSVSRESLQEKVALETPMVHSSNPFLSSTSTEGEPYRYDYGAAENRMVPHLNTPDPLSMAEIAPRDFLISQGDNMQTFESLTLPAAENEKPNGRPHTLLNRPRDPLIEAVAAHDKSTLRRVSEMVLPLAKPESERNTLLEQIRNKSFSLKPATVSKPHIKGPSTNLKVAAILERANAIRQHCVKPFCNRHLLEATKMMMGIVGVIHEPCNPKASSIGFLASMQPCSGLHISEQIKAEAASEKSLMSRRRHHR
ncbi:hypothetical protein Taro_034548 [Colocasia esculenta]|uniref:Protein SCAR n=1 Tax=Colocasia esculenta TaxID=4460 RepID=A0A843WFT8_COLES|nr:hypothetical protein [Colocasia esculenta]